MRIENIGIGNANLQSSLPSSKVSEKSFGDTIKDAVSKVSDMQSNADQVSNKLASGDAVEIHQAMIAMQKASMALQFTVQVRNKVLEAYQEIMRMQV